jgi:hypothetical protein
MTTLLTSIIVWLYVGGLFLIWIAEYENPAGVRTALWLRVIWPVSVAAAVAIGLFEGAADAIRKRSAP